MEHRAWSVRRDERDGRFGWQAMSHMPSPSLSHYASLSFVVRGGGKTSEVGRQRTENNFGFRIADSELPTLKYDLGN